MKSPGLVGRSVLTARSMYHLYHYVSPHSTVSDKQYTDAYTHLHVCKPEWHHELFALTSEIQKWLVDNIKTKLLQ